MRYKFSAMAGRLTTSPVQTPTRFWKGMPEPATIQYPKGTTFAKTITGSGPSGRYGPVPTELAQKMAHFQLPNNLPVHLRGGPMDKVLYGITSAVCLVGLIECFRVYYLLSYPQVKED